MPLNNSQYDQIMRDYSRRRFEQLHAQENRINQICRRCPRLKDVLSEINAVSAAIVRNKLRGDMQGVMEASQKQKQLRAEKLQLLKSIGCTPKDLEIHYICPDCKDTGYIRNQKCHCLKQAEIDLLYTQSHLKQVLKAENFSRLSMEYYSKDPNPQLKGKSNYDYMTDVIRHCHRFAVNFEPGCGNFLFFGKTGVGKTFLANCIAKEVLERAFSVLSLTASELFDCLCAKDTEDAPFESHEILDCDLLIIDDLGTEMATAFTLRQLFYCLNERLLAKKSTIISSNLSIGEIRSVYSERISSRIMSSYDIYQIYGEDIRILKKYSS